ncbi:hypothetical protein GCM10010172_70710 [Paractinoplanes ferrugineus]|uniref:Uncharacterized protein n=1 Tax=Paractinoplanes ferrugineus TaxID=113564 RepID=A0A919MCP9_9ACTN|nr:hypothetical protein [Actinoplanes ferrugineus]GIE14956.1 hypothetical protein Afe05nite_67960 [Actinoplanes ferrugineus]
MTAAPLERRYRRLLLAYPGRYRRVHGAEMVTTLMDMADAGQSRPFAAEAWHLFLGGLRQRFRVPSGRPLVLVAAVLTTLIGGGFGAAAGSWTAERTFTALPGDAAVAALTRQAAGGGGDDFSTDRSASPWFTEMVLGAVDSPGWTAQDAERRLAADGWRVGATRNLAGAVYSSSTSDGRVERVEARSAAFDATRDGLLMQVTGHVSAGHGTVSIMLWPADTGALKPLTVAGLLLGLLGGWMVAAAGAYRMRESPGGRRRIAALLAGLAVAALATPAFAFYINVMRVLEASGSVVNTVHSALNASPYWSYSTPWMLVQLSVAGALFAIVAWLMTDRRGTTGSAVPAAG